MRKPAGLSFVFLFAAIMLKFSPASGQNQVDAGIFESPVMDTLVIKARPNFNLASPNYISNIAFTIRWPDTSAVTGLVNITSTVNSFFGIAPQQFSTHGGYRYQVYVMIGQRFVNWTAGAEYPILEIRVNYPGGDCTTFEIANDSYTNSINGAYYFEVVGSDYTGIRYQPSVSLVSIGGSVSPGENICLGSSTSVMTLSGHSGSILTWQKKHDSFPWANIASTTGLTQYTATPDSTGTYLYRAMVRRSTCDTVYALPAEITVEGYARWNGTTDTLWNNPMNWNVCGVPTITRDAEVPVVISGLYPSVVTAGNCKSLTIRSGAVVRLRPEGSLNVGGAVYQPAAGEIQATRRE